MRTGISCAEYRFLKILWELEPIVSPELVSVCRQRLEWTKSTTYTVIRRLSVKRIIINNRSTVSSLVSQSEAQRIIINEFLQSYFDGSPDIFIDAVVHMKAGKSEMARCDKVSAETALRQDAH